MIRSNETMARINREAWSTHIAMAAMLVALSARLALGEDDWDAQGRAPAAGAVDRMRAMRAMNMEANVTQQACGSENQAQAEKKVESLLTLRVRSLERAGGLSKEQAEKLRLAGDEDARRFFRELDDLREQCRGLTWNDRKFQEIWPKVTEMQSRFNGGLFTDGSLFQKVLLGLARDNPTAPYLKEEQKRRQARFQATIQVTVMQFETGASLTDAQRQKFLKLLCDELKPPHRLGRQAEFAVFYQMTKIDESKLKSIFDDKQWRALSMWLRNAKAMETHLKRQGFVP